MPRSNEECPGRSWFPFRAIEVELALALAGLAAALASYVGWTGTELITLTLGLLVFAYLSGLLATSGPRRPKLLRGGALAGEGYRKHFSRARSSLLLMHVDADEPSPELLQLYTRLLSRGIQVRRILFPLPGAGGPPSWALELPNHSGLLQRMSPEPEGLLARASFAVVDSDTVLIATPGTAPVEASEYQERFALRDLLVIRDQEIAERFAEVHRDLWSRSHPLGVASKKAG